MAPEAGKDVSTETSDEPDVETPDVVDAPAEAESGFDVDIVDVVEAEAPVLKAAGESCASASECASGSCDDAVCCATPCSGPCRACNAQGLCDSAPSGTNVGNECGSCGACDGMGKCTCPIGESCSTALDPNDCALLGQCAACAADADCPSGRCESCACQPLLGNSVFCNEDTDCSSKHCNQGWDPLDCSATGSCQNCGTDSDCPTGRCEYCNCVAKVQPGQACDEPTDCTTGRCGATAGSDLNDCSGFYLCAECSDDFECAGGRCEACKCVERAPSGYCNEDSDCVSLLCGSEIGGDVKDCATAASCVECRTDDQCTTGRCDVCKCAAKEAAGATCDEDTDCLSGTCTTYKCQ